MIATLIYFDPVERFLQMGLKKSASKRRASRVDPRPSSTGDVPGRSEKERPETSTDMAPSLNFCAAKMSVLLVVSRCFERVSLAISARKLSRKHWLKQSMPWLKF